MSTALLDAGRTLALLPYPSLVDALRAAVVELADGRIVCPVRQVVALPSGGRLLSMTAVAADLAVHKLITVMPANKVRGLPTIDGRVSVLDGTTGRIVLTLDAASVTGRRTAAMTMLGIATFASVPPRAALLFGTGMQALHHVEAFAAMFPGTTVHVVGRDAASAARFVAHHPEIAAHAVALARPGDAPAVDVVVTCTSSREPVYEDRPGRHRSVPLIIATGSFEPDVAEIEAELVRRCRVHVDDPAGAAHEAGDLIAAVIPADRISSLADVLTTGRVVHDRSILFKTVGCAAWDLAAARVASKRASRTDAAC